MAVPRLKLDTHQIQLARLEESRARTDLLFHLVRPEALYDRPIPKRHRLIFYLGHLETFDWNLLGRGAFELPSFHPEFDKLFAFGIDPISGNLPTDQASDWPVVSEIERYNKQVRERLDACLASAACPPLVADETLLHVAIEHRLMHAETLTYVLHELPIEKKYPQFPPRDTAGPLVTPRSVPIPEGVATLGQQRNGSFGWDNEFQAHSVVVPAFAIEAYPVTNGQFMEFVRAGGYSEKALWTEEDWQWKEQGGVTHPHFWVRRENDWYFRSMFAEIPLPLSWPVCTSHAEAAAYACWAGKSLPTEAQWHRAAYGTPRGMERIYPWGEEPPDMWRGNFDFHRWHSTPVTSHLGGASAFGVVDLLGNGWEWTSTPFGPLPGFERFPFYPGYSADFFEGKHYVAKGGSWRTAACMLRRSFRNWFQPHYPYAYTTFRCVDN